MKKNIFILFLCILCIPLSAQFFSEEEEAYAIGTGKSMDRETALRLASFDALNVYVQENIPKQQYNRFQKDIEKYLVLHYKRYFRNPPLLLAWDGWEMKVQVFLKKELLLSEIECKINIPDIQNKVAIVQWNDISSLGQNQEILKNIVQSNLEQTFQRYGIKFTTQQAIEDEIQQEIKESGTIASPEEIAYIEKTRANYRIHLGIRAQEQERTWKRYTYHYWNTQISIEIYTHRTNQKIFTGLFPPPHANYGTKMYHNNSDKNYVLESLIAKVSQYASQASADYIRDHRPVPSNQYIIYFAEFTALEKQKIIKALEAMQSKNRIYQFTKTIGGGGSLKIQLTTQQKIHTLQDNIQTYCIEQGVHAMLDPTRHEDQAQHFFFIPH
ncbi:MAG TPA: hypothetical protein P5543_04305 [Planctomycetota bacterium]|nr:hypothetical protein [Planctomycetota bacterium]